MNNSDSGFKAPRPIPTTPIGWNPPTKTQTVIPANVKIRNMADPKEAIALGEVKKALRAIRKETKAGNAEGSPNVSKEERQAAKLAKVQAEKDARKLLKPGKVEKPFKATVQYQDGFAAAYLSGNLLVCFFAELKDARLFIQENLDEASAMHGKVEKVKVRLNSENKPEEVSRIVLTMSRGEYLASFKAPRADEYKPSRKRGSLMKKRPKYETGNPWQSVHQDRSHFSHG